jgi:CTP synthase
VQEKKYIFVTGGVLSSIGKGVITASLGNILKSYGYKVVMKKFDPYLNVDSGTMNPYQHGEVYVTFDGGETDLDLGHYERFTGEQLQKEFCITSGQIYQAIIKKEREHAFGGETIQIIPHITDLIKNKIEYLPADSDTQIIITEIGGTVGDIESLAFIEAMRQLKTEKGKENVLFILLTIAFKLNANGEVKTKPTQHALRTLLSLGVQPDILICRASETLDKNVINKIALFSNLKTKHIYSAIDCDSIYKMPALLQEQSIMNSINEYLSLPEIKIRNNLP